MNTSVPNFSEKILENEFVWLGNILCQAATHTGFRFSSQQKGRDDSSWEWGLQLQGTDVRLVCAPLADFWLLNLHTKKTLKPFLYRIASMAIKFRGGNLTELEQHYWQVRKQLFHPICCAILSDLGLNNPTLLGLPEHLKIKIVSNLHLRDRQAVASTCTYMRELTQPLLAVQVDHSLLASLERLTCGTSTTTSVQPASIASNLNRLHSLNSTDKRTWPFPCSTTLP